MKTFIALSIATLMALTPMLGTAHAQRQAPTGQKIEQASPNPPARTQQQTRKPQWKKGGKYSGKGSRVSDHRRHNLKAPPKGHRWVRDGNDFLLVAIGSGIIASIVTGR